MNRTAQRYPYFLVRMVKEGADIFFEDNPLSLPVINTAGRVTLGSAQTDYHLIAICYWQNWIHIDCYHALTDGGGIHPMITTLMYLYISGYYETELDVPDVSLPGSEIAQAEWDDPGAVPLPKERAGLVKKWNSHAFQLDESRINLQPESIVTTISISEKEFIPFSISNDGSPATVVSLLLARSLEMVHPDTADPVVIAMCVNQRNALGAPLAHQSLVGDVRVVYSEKFK